MQLPEKIDWAKIEAELSPLYMEIGGPANPIRLMAGLNLLKHMFNPGDETVIKVWVENPCYHGASAKEEDVILDRTVHEKNMTQSTDVKLLLGD